MKTYGAEPLVRNLAVSSLVKLKDNHQNGRALGTAFLLSTGIRVSRLRRTQMGVRIDVRDGESIEQALKRFKNLLWRQGSPGADGKRPKWHKAAA